MCSPCQKHIGQGLASVRVQQRTAAHHLWVCYTPVPKDVVDDNDAPRTNQVQELLKIGLVGPLVRICSMWQHRSKEPRYSLTRTSPHSSVPEAAAAGCISQKVCK